MVSNKSDAISSPAHVYISLRIRNEFIWVRMAGVVSDARKELECIVAPQAK